MTRVTRAQQRAATRQALIDAAVRQLQAHGVSGVSTRQVARDVDVSQSTVMYHFSTREELLAATVSQLAVQLADQARVHFEEATAAGPLGLEDYLDLIWREITTPEALSVAQLWIACWSEPQFVETVRTLEQHLYGLGVRGAVALARHLSSDVSARAYVDTVFSVVRGLIMSIPVWGIENVHERWEHSKATLLRAARAEMELPAGS